MTKNRIMMLMLAGASFASVSLNHGAWASQGRGGGDIQCDNLIQNLVFQDPAGNLRSWIKNGGPEAGKLDLSSSLNPNTGKPYTYAEYDTAMLALINTFAKSPDVNCVRPGDNGYPVSVDDTSKICTTSVDQNGVHMTCDRNLFIALTTDQQIEQTHHEFAINVPGLEPDTDSISTYKISTQLSGSIADVTERRLVVKRPTSVDVDSPACQGLRQSLEMQYDLEPNKQTEYLAIANQMNQDLKMAFASAPQNIKNLFAAYNAGTLSVPNGVMAGMSTLTRYLFGDQSSLMRKWSTGFCPEGYTTNPADLKSKTAGSCVKGSDVLPLYIFSNVRFDLSEEGPALSFKLGALQYYPSKKTGWFTNAPATVGATDMNSINVGATPPKVAGINADGTINNQSELISAIAFNLSDSLAANYNVDNNVLGLMQRQWRSSGCFKPSSNPTQAPQDLIDAEPPPENPLDSIDSSGGGPSPLTVHLGSSFGGGGVTITHIPEPSGN